MLHDNKNMLFFANGNHEQLLQMVIKRINNNSKTLAPIETLLR